MLGLMGKIDGDIFEYIHKNKKLINYSRVEIKRVSINSILN